MSRADDYPYLTPVEDRILTALEKRRGRVVSREVLSMDVYGHTYPGRALDVHVRRIRQKLGLEVITTRYGYGYVLGTTHRCDACEGRGFVVD